MNIPRCEAHTGLEALTLHPSCDANPRSPPARLALFVQPWLQDLVETALERTAGPLGEKWVTQRRGNGDQGELDWFFDEVPGSWFHLFPLLTRNRKNVPRLAQTWEHTATNARKREMLAGNCSSHRFSKVSYTLWKTANMIHP